MWRASVEMPLRVMITKFQDPMKVLWLIGKSWSSTITDYLKLLIITVRKSGASVHTYIDLSSLKNRLNQTIFTLKTKLQEVVIKHILTFRTFYTFLSFQPFLLSCIYPVNSVLPVIVRMWEIRVFIVSASAAMITGIASFSCFRSYHC